MSGDNRMGDKKTDAADDGVDMNELAQAFGGKGAGNTGNAGDVDVAARKDANKDIKEQRVKRKRSGKAKKWAVAVFVVGLLALIGGGVFFAVRQMQKPPMDDVDFLMEAGEWVREDNDTVIWDFTEVGKGKLTTDKHLNNYDFTWSLKDGKLTIDTAWLYDLSDEFEYKLDQGAKTLTITNSDKGTEVKFKAQERPKTAEPSEDSSEGSSENTAEN